MPRTAPSLSAVLAHLRLGRGWAQRELARAAGVPPQAVSDYERGTHRKLSQEKLIHFANLMGYGEEDVRLARLFHDLLAGSEGADLPSPLEPSRTEAERAGRLAVRIALTEAVQRRSEMLALARSRRVTLARRDAAAYWATLRGLAPSAQQHAIETSPQALRWALGEHLCEESARFAARDADAALRLARLALRVTELCPADHPWRTRLSGYVWSFIANSQRVLGDHRAAELSFATAWSDWNAGAPADFCPLGQWRLHDLEASLRRDQRRFADALDCIERALASAPLQARVRILLNKQFVLEQAGEIEAALGVLDEAASLLDATPEPRLRWVLEINRVTMLCHRGRYPDAEARLPGLKELTARLGNKLDAARVVWVTGRVAAGLGRRTEAVTAFEEVQQTFSALRIGFDAALVSIELAILYLEEGRNAEVAVLAEDMMSVFRVQRVRRETLAALRIFCEAAQAGAATVQLARRLQDYLQRARRNPRARFEAAD